MALLAALLRFSVERRWLIVALAIAVAGLGVWNFQRLPIDAVPDITNVQVQINTQVEALAPAEIERRVTAPIEAALGGIPNVIQIRSLSRYGLSQVTIVFEDGTDIYRARQLVNERLNAAAKSLPPGAEPELGPISTGLGEIFMWTLTTSEGAKKPNGSPYDATDLREIHDWVVRPQMMGIQGVTEINAIGGQEKLFQVAPDPNRLVSYGLSFGDVLGALQRNNLASGGGYVEQRGEQVLIRLVGLLSDEADILAVVIRDVDGVPVRIGDVAEVSVAAHLRTGAATANGEEVVIGTAIMLLGENSRTVSQRVAARIEEVKKSLPAGVELTTVYDRTYLVDATLSTVTKSLLEGAALVVVILVLLLGNLRAAVIAALTIPFAMLVAVSGMVATDTSGNLMSLGAIDFGLIVDGSVIIVENCVRRFAVEQHRLGRRLTNEERMRLAYEASHEVRKATLFGELIISIVYLPILTLTGIEGKMFRPMAITVVLALAGATVLSMTLVPALVAIGLRGDIREKESLLIRLARRAYEQVVSVALEARAAVVIFALAVLVGAAALAVSLGSEFAPKLSEGALAVQPARIPSIGITTSVEMQKKLERTLLEQFPDEIDRVFARTGTAEVATDPMGPNVSDTYLMLKPREQWTKAKTQEELAEAIEDVLRDLPGQNYEFSQPIELRFNELISGVRSDVAVKVFGDDPAVMLAQANRIAGVMGAVEGASDVKVEQVTGLPVLTIDIDGEQAGRYGLSVEDVQRVVDGAFGGAIAGQVFQGDRRFDLVVRLPEGARGELSNLANLPIPISGRADDEEHGEPGFIPVGAVAKISLEEGPNQVSRENGKRRIVVQCNVRGRDLGGFVAELQTRIDAEITPVAGTWFAYGGQFENLIAARQRLMVVVPVALALIFALLYASFHSVRNALLIFSGVPFALTGGIAALAVRGMPISISAAVGFIALSGVAVLNGLVLVTFIEGLRESGHGLDAAVHDGASARLRPVLMTALVASLGFVPMALATGMGSEVQRPLATVVIGGILSSTVLTLIVLPVLYRMVHANEPVAPPSSRRISVRPPAARAPAPNGIG